jgi:hypothetical protein
MNIISKTLIMAGLSSLMAFPASAELITTDWLTPGDQLVLTDTDSGLEFLKLSVTANVSISNMKNLFDNTYSGWRLATVSDATDIFTKLLEPYGGFGSSATNTISGNLLPAYDLIGFNVINGTMYSLSIVESSNHTNSLQYTLFGLMGSENNHTAINNRTSWAYSDYVASNNYGVLVVRDTANEDVETSDVHAPVILSAFSLIGLGLIRRRKQH